MKISINQIKRINKMKLIKKNQRQLTKKIERIRNTIELINKWFTFFWRLGMILGFIIWTGYEKMDWYKWAAHS